MQTSDSPVKSGASQLMRSLGLYVDGPARWGHPIPSRAPGVFVVELPGPVAEPPIEFAAVRRWVERVPTMTVDGEAATPHALLNRLATFWLTGEPILYVGRSAKTIGGRLAAIHATPLGDVRPSAAANWIKALAVRSELRVWWSETDAHEEYEDALLAEVAARNDGRLPFANPVTASGERREDGLRGTLLAEPEAPAGRRPASKGTSRLTTRKGSNLAAGGGSAARAGGARPSPARAAKSGPPAPEPTYLSSEGLERLTAELEELRVKVRPGVIARVKAARELGDLRENADYEYARKEQSFVEGRIQSLEQMIKTSVVIEAAGSDTAHLGSTVVIESDGEEVTYLLVGPSEADPAAGRISHVSPVGSALLGARPGDEVSVRLPSGSVSYRVRQVG